MARAPPASKPAGTLLLLSFLLGGGSTASACEGTTAFAVVAGPRTCGCGRAGRALLEREGASLRSAIHLLPVGATVPRWNQPLGPSHDPLQQWLELRRRQVACPPLRMAAGLYEQPRMPVGARFFGTLLAFLRWLQWLVRGPLPLLSVLPRQTQQQQQPTARTAPPPATLHGPSAAVAAAPGTSAGAAATRTRLHRPYRPSSAYHGLIEDAGPTLDERPLQGGDVPLTSRVLAWGLEQLIYKAALRAEGLTLLVEAASNRKALSGNLKTVWCGFRTLVLPCLQITGGASLVVTGVDLKMLWLMHKRLGAFKRPFQVRGEYVFTNNDFIASPAVRNLAQHVVSASFAKLSLGRVRVTRVGIHGDRILIDGQSDVLQRFSCSANLDTSADGHVVCLRSLKYGNQAGEYLFNTPWHVAATLPKDLVSVDMGDNTRIEKLAIKDGRLTVRGCFVVSPTPPLIVADVGKRGMVHYDVGERLSALVAEILDNALSLNALRFW